MDRTVKLYIFYDTSRRQVDATPYNLWANNADPSDPRKKVTSESVWYFLDEIDYTIPEGFDPVSLTIEGLEAALQKEIADSHVRQERFKEEIGRLKCLTHEPLKENLNDEDLEWSHGNGNPDNSAFDDISF